MQRASVFGVRPEETIDASLPAEVNVLMMRRIFPVRDPSLVPPVPCPSSTHREDCPPPVTNTWKALRNVFTEGRKPPPTSSLMHTTIRLHKTRSTGLLQMRLENPVPTDTLRFGGHTGCPKSSDTFSPSSLQLSMGRGQSKSKPT